MAKVAAKGGGTLNRELKAGKLRTYSLKDRPSKISVRNFAREYAPEGKARELVDMMPNILAGRDFREVVAAIAGAVRKGKVVALGMGAHPIKVGLSPLIIQLMREKVISAVAMNGAGVVHDFEIAYAGKTSEDVDSALDSGDFGMARETGELVNWAISVGARKGWGIGRSVGQMIATSKYPHKDLSILATGYEMDIPVTVHVAVGTDIVHMHPAADGPAIGKSAMTDFRIFCNVVSNLGEGVYINLGSAVIMPEVFLKAVSVARNSGSDMKGLTTVAMDFIRHYRPATNVVSRPTAGTGRGYYIVGHHELMFPLLCAAVLDELNR
jgi:hypothetical protein